MLETFKYNIDSQNDGVLFEMDLFNQGRYDKERLRAIIVNTALRLTVINQFSTPITVEELYFGIVFDSLLNKTFTSSGFKYLFPLSMEPAEKLSIMFYAFEIKSKLGKLLTEKGVFILKIAGKEQRVHSSLFDGDELEKTIRYLEDNEEANHGSKEFFRLDTECI